MQKDNPEHIKKQCLELDDVLFKIRNIGFLREVPILLVIENHPGPMATGFYSYILDEVKLIKTTGKIHLTRLIFLTEANQTPNNVGITKTKGIEDEMYNLIKNCICLSPHLCFWSEFITGTSKGIDKKRNDVKTTLSNAMKNLEKGKKFNAKSGGLKDDILTALAYGPIGNLLFVRDERKRYIKEKQKFFKEYQ